MSVLISFLVEKLRKQAEAMVKKRMLEEAQRLGIKVAVNDKETEVTSWALLRDYFSKADGLLSVKAMYDIAIGVFEISPAWMEDTETILLNYMGWEYDPESLDVGKNKLGNGCIEKMISRTKTDARTNLRKCCKEGTSGYTLPIKRPASERYDGKGNYIRRTPGFKNIGSAVTKSSGSKQARNTGGNEVAHHKVMIFLIASRFI